MSSNLTTSCFVAGAPQGLALFTLRTGAAAPAARAPAPAAGRPRRAGRLASGALEVAGAAPLAAAAAAAAWLANPSRRLWMSTSSRDTCVDHRRPAVADVSMPAARGGAEDAAGMAATSLVCWLARDGTALRYAAIWVMVRLSPSDTGPARMAAHTASTRPDVSLVNLCTMGRLR